MNSLIYNFESIYPYDDAVVRYGTLLIRVTGGGGSDFKIQLLKSDFSGSIDNIDSSEIGVLFVLHQIALYNWDLHYEFVFIRECQIKSKIFDWPYSNKNKWYVVN